MRRAAAVAAAGRGSRRCEGGVFQQAARAGLAAPLLAGRWADPGLLRGGQTPSPEFMFRRCRALVASVPKFDTHMSGSAIDISVMHLDEPTRDVDRGAPYPEMSAMTPMASPFVSEQAQRNRRDTQRHATAAARAAAEQLRRNPRRDRCRAGSSGLRHQTLSTHGHGGYGARAGADCG